MPALSFSRVVSSLAIASLCPAFVLSHPPWSRLSPISGLEQFSSLLRHFARYSTYPTELGLSHAATHMLDGTQVATQQVSFPWMLVLMPSEEAKRLAAECSHAACTPATSSIDGSRAEGDDTEDSWASAFQKQLQVLPIGTHLYDVYAVASPEAIEEVVASEGGLIHVGQVKTTSQFIRSAAEHELHFWHQRKEEDYEWRPEWREQLTSAHAHACGAEHFARMIVKGQYGAPGPASEYSK